MNEKTINFIISALGATRTSDKSVEYLQACDYAIKCLEAKGKYDRMAPIYNNKESFESALKKAWRFYNNSGSRTVDSCEDNYIECVFSKGFREGFLYKEKQKEKKPILEVFGFKVGDAVRLKDGDGRKHIIKSFEEVEGVHGSNFYHVEFEDNSARDGIYPDEKYPNGYYTQMEKIEEQKSVECNEDEKIRKWLYDYISNCPNNNFAFYGGVGKDAVLNYLKKQKEQPTNEEMLRTLRAEYEKGVADTIAKYEQKEQKHPDGCWSCNDYKKGYEAGRLNGFTAGYNKAMKEQKPVEWSDTNELVFKDICKHLKEEGYGGWVMLLNALRNGEFQSKQEWSEEDEERLKSVIHRIEVQFAGNLYGEGKLDVDWLKSLPERFVLQPKQEQNGYITPHKEFFKFIYDRLINVHKENPNVDYMRSFKERLNNLSFEEKQEWSEEDEKVYQYLKDGFEYSGNRLSDQEHIMPGLTIGMYRSFIDKLKSLRPQPHWKPSEKKYDGNMDKECIKLCDILNSIPSIDTFGSCCGHLKDRYSIWFFCNDIITISRLGRCVERNYSDGKWELLVDSTDTHPTGVFWLRSKVPFQSYDEMEKSVNELCNHIQYWFNTKFDSYFNGNSCK